MIQTVEEFPMKTTIKAFAVLVLATAAFALAPNVKISIEAPSAQACPSNDPLCDD